MIRAIDCDLDEPSRRCLYTSLVLDCLLAGPAGQPRDLVCVVRSVALTDSPYRAKVYGLVRKN